MRKYLIVAALILCAPQPILAQAEGFYLVLDNTTKQCRVMPGSELPSTQKARDIKSWANTPRWMRPRQLWTPCSEVPAQNYDRKQLLIAKRD